MSHEACGFLAVRTSAVENLSPQIHTDLHGPTLSDSEEWLDLVKRKIKRSAAAEPSESAKTELRTSVVDPDHVEVLDSSNRSELTLVTCYPFHYIGAAPRRFVVQAALMSGR
jgi:hypothetical protein